MTCVHEILSMSKTLYPQFLVLKFTCTSIFPWVTQYSLSFSLPAFSEPASSHLFLSIYSLFVVIGDFIVKLSRCQVKNHCSIVMRIKLIMAVMGYSHTFCIILFTLSFMFVVIASYRLPRKWDLDHFSNFTSSSRNLATPGYLFESRRSVLGTLKYNMLLMHPCNILME